MHVTTHGSGFPTVERNPRNAYSTDPWNLTVLPLHPESLFRHIKSDISGMTVPWLYVGMVFSTFCWHNEDHWAYSANYQHFGATKTWYGIPAEDTAKFENAMRETVPELFETQPDLLFQLVTLLPPEKLKKAGVRVYALDQRAGQFVITFPEAYHAGFNHGFNFNEAVNFAPSDWEPFGDSGVQRLQEFRRQPCFSHDELLMTAAARDNPTIKTAKWLAPALERMRDRELSQREAFLARHKAKFRHVCKIDGGGINTGAKCELEVVEDPSDYPEEEVACTYCKTYAYLSRFHCNVSGKVVCLLHAGSYECCETDEEHRSSGANGEHTLIYRLSNDSLEASVQKVREKADLPETWTKKLDELLEDDPKPALRSLKTLLAEGERISWDLPGFQDLKRFVERCNVWVEEATNFITRKQQNRRKNERAWRRESKKAAEADEKDRDMRKVETIIKLLKEAEEVSFDCPEIATLQERADSIAEFQKEAQTALRNFGLKTTQEMDDLVERGKGFNVDIPEVEALEKLVLQLKWYDRAREVRDQSQTLKQVVDFLQQGSELGISESDPSMLFFQEQKQGGELWEAKAKELMSLEVVPYHQLDALSRQASTIPVTPETLAAMEAVLKKQRDVQDQIYGLVSRSKNPDFRQRPKYKECKDAIEVLNELACKPAGTLDLEREQKRHEDWMRRGKKLFGKANAPLHILHQHMQFVEQRNASCFDLNDLPRDEPAEPASRAATPEPDQIADETVQQTIFCICRKPEAGMMIECELCHEW